ncbi:endophilin-A1-like [Ruditapes philippinarum]|uniref:endophilin-A1-like n=1 Tax=Ruditapes philippinarum TaxID=129788 RepID=UPI00295B0C65|nr:endophilin-A1-like [Ruditapes philippinarum]
MALGGSLNLDNLSDQTFDLLCRICKRKGNNSEAEKYCLECQDYFCLKCVKVHEDVPSIMDHNILDKSQFPSDSAKIVGSRKTLSDKSIERCDKHSHNGIDMYCQIHDQVGCGTCMTLAHRNCQDTFYIPEYISDTGLTTSIKEVEEKLDSVSMYLTRQHESIKSEQDQLLERKKLLVDNITKFRKEINDKLDDLEKVTISDADNTYKSLTNEMKNAMRMLQNMKETIAGYRERIKSNSNNQTTRFVTLKKAEDIDHTASKLEIKLKKGKSFGNIEFEAGQKLSTLLKDMNSYDFTAQQPAQKYQHPQQPCQPPPQQYQPPLEPKRPRDKSAGKGMVCKAMYDYDAVDTDEVDMREGDLIVFCKQFEAGWSEGTVERTGKRGFLPSNYVEKIN